MFFALDGLGEGEMGGIGGPMEFFIEIIGVGAAGAEGGFSAGFQVAQIDVVIADEGPPLAIGGIGVGFMAFVVAIGVRRGRSTDNGIAAGIIGFKDGELFAGTGGDEPDVAGVGVLFLGFASRNEAVRLAVAAGINPKEFDGVGGLIDEIEEDIIAGAITGVGGG